MLRDLKWRMRVQSLRSRKRREYPHNQWSQLPVVVGNAMAKSGSHIISQFLEGISLVSPLVFTDYHPIRTISASGERYSQETTLRELRRLQRGDIGWGYLPAREPFTTELHQNRYLGFFAFRDPRDRIISQIMYALNIHEGHRMRASYQALPTMEKRIEATIRGVPGKLKNVREIYDSYIGWMQIETVLCVRFEDLVHKRETTLRQMIDYLRSRGIPIERPISEVLDTLGQSMAPNRSPTFRSGTSGEWREYFSEANVDQFKSVAGDLLTKLGYEKSDAWGVQSA